MWTYHLRHTHSLPVLNICQRLKEKIGSSQGARNRKIIFKLKIFIEFELQFKTDLGYESGDQTGPLDTKSSGTKISDTVPLSENSHTVVLLFFHCPETNDFKQYFILYFFLSRRRLLFGSFGGHIAIPSQICQDGRCWGGGDIFRPFRVGAGGG
jgi:hypothetical protein